MSICATNTYGFLPGWWWLCEAGYHLMKSDQLTQHPSCSWQSDFVIKTQFIIPVGVFLPISLPPIHFSWSHSIVFLSADNRPMAPNFNISKVLSTMFGAGWINNFFLSLCLSLEAGKYVYTYIILLSLDSK